MNRFSTVLALISLLGCASPPASNTYYLLRGETVDATVRVDTPLQAGLGRVIVAPYLLSSKGLMVETAPGEINPASQHQWAEPLDAGLRWYLRDEIGKSLGRDIAGSLTERASWEYTVDVAIAQFHGTMSGSAVIKAQFIVIPESGSKRTSEVRFSKTLALDEPGYAGLVQAEKQLAKELADLIADELQARMNAVTPTTDTDD